MPMKRPGSVSKTSTPSRAATAAMKSGAGREAVDPAEPAACRGGRGGRRARDVDELDHGGDHDGGERRLGEVLEETRSGTAA